jgi:proteasome accessory factor A
MAELLFGVETEYAIAGVSSGGEMDCERILRRIMELAKERLIHLPDLNSSMGIFLGNGSRFYADCGNHPELCTPECANPWDAVRYIEAGHRILAGLASSLESASLPGAQILCFRCNVDYSGGQTTWGCHESYMHRIEQEALQPQIIPHLVTRLIYTGAGGFNPLSRGLEFTLSPRMAHFRQVVTLSSTSERGIWHTKSESLCSGYNRLHVLCGESLCSETAAFLKVGVTALIVAMADAGLAPGGTVQLADPLAAMQSVAADVTCKKPLRMADGRLMSAIEIQRHYLRQAEAHLGASFMPVWAAEVCSRWGEILDRLEDAPGSVEKTLDWSIKHALYANHARSLNIRWEALPVLNRAIGQLSAALCARKGSENAMPLESAIEPRRWMPKEVTSLEPLLRTNGLGLEDLRRLLGFRQKFFEIDTRFGQLGSNGIFQSLDLAGVLEHRISGVDNIEQAVAEPPASGRARIRGQVIQRLSGTSDVRCDWQSVINFGEGQVLRISDPFTSEESWTPLTRELDDDLPAFVDPHDPYTRRQEAVDRILTGDYAGAEALVRGLLAERFMMPSTLCHLARVLLMTDREEEARELIRQAWAIRREASNYVVPRILFFQSVYAIFDGVDFTALVARIRTALDAPGSHNDWTIVPMIDHLRSRLGETNYLFLKALAEALSDDRAMPRLDGFPQWRDAVAVASQAAD